MVAVSMYSNKEHSGAVLLSNTALTTLTELFIEQPLHCACLLLFILQISSTIANLLLFVTDTLPSSPGVLESYWLRHKAKSLSKIYNKLIRPWLLLIAMCFLSSHEEPGQVPFNLVSVPSQYYNYTGQGY